MNSQNATTVPTTTVKAMSHQPRASKCGMFCHGLTNGSNMSPEMRKVRPLKVRLP